LAAGVYNTDLKDINLCETTTDFSALGGGASGLGAGIDFAIQGTNAIDKQVSNNLKGMVYDTGSTVTLGADEHILIWMICSTPGLTSAQSIGGLRITVGTATNAYNEWYVNGNDTLPAGGMQNYAVHTSSTADNTVGSPGANPQVFGGQADVTQTAKGVNFALDAMRYGTGFYLTEGDATTPITFESASVENDLNANRYGIFTAIEGGFGQKGRFVVGQDSNFNTTQSYFTDSNKNVVFIDTPFSLPDFTQIIVDHPDTFFDLRAISFTAEGTNNPGQLVFNNSSTTGSLVNCQFNNTGKAFFKENVQVTGSSFNSTDTIFQSGSTLFDSSFRTTTGVSSSVLVDDPSKLSFNSFDNDGSKHGIEVIVTGSYVFEANIFSNFDSGSNANEALYFNPTGGAGDLTLQVIGGGTSVEFRNASSGTVTIENNASITVTGLQDNTEVRIFDSATTGPQTELAGIEDAIDGTPGNRSFTFSLPVGTTVDIVLISVQYENERLDDFTLSVSQDLPFEQTFDRNYENPEQGEIAALFNSLQSRSEYFENQSSEEEFITFLDDENLLSSASAIYVSSGYSLNKIHSLLPSSSAGDLIMNEKFLVNRPEFAYNIGKLNSSGYFNTSSENGIPFLDYSPYNLGTSGSFFSPPPSTPGTDFPVTFVDNPSGDVFNTANNLTSSSNAVITYPSSGVTSPDNGTRSTELKDDNSGGSKEVYLLYENVAVQASSNLYISVFASSSGAEFLFISASDFTSNSGGAQWYNLFNGTVESSVNPSGNIYTASVQEGYPNGWRRYDLNFSQIDNTTTGKFYVGISDTDGGSTVTADNTAKVNLWGLMTSRTTTNTPPPIQTNYSGSLTSLRNASFSGSINLNTDMTVYIEANGFAENLVRKNTTKSNTVVSLYNNSNPTLTDLTINYGYSTTAPSNTIAFSGRSNGTFVISGGSNAIDNAFGLGADPFYNRGFVKSAVRLKSGDSKAHINGNVATSNTNTFTEGWDKIVLFGDRTSSNEGRIRRVVIFTPGLTDAQQATLTSNS
jgi:hypothetical protein